MNELIYEKVKEMYVDRRVSMTKCAKEFGVSVPRMNKFLIENGLKVDTSKTVTQSKKGKTQQSKKKTDSNSSDKVKESKSKKQRGIKSEITELSDEKKIKSKPKKEKPVTLEDKIIYCNNKYSYNCWRFMDRQELKEALMMDLMM